MGPEPQNSKKGLQRTLLRLPILCSRPLLCEHSASVPELRLPRPSCPVSKLPVRKTLVNRSFSCLACDPCGLSSPVGRYPHSTLSSGDDLPGAGTSRNSLELVFSIAGLFNLSIGGRNLFFFPDRWHKNRTIEGAIPRDSRSNPASLRDFGQVVSFGFGRSSGGWPDSERSASHRLPFTPLPSGRFYPIRH